MGTPAGVASQPVLPMPWAPSPGALPKGIRSEDGRMLFERAQAGLMVVQRGIVRYANQKLAEMHGYTVAELSTGLVPALQLVAPIDREKVREKIRRRAFGEYVFGTDVRALRKDGSEFDVCALVSRIELDGEVGELLALDDVSDLMAAKRSAEQRAQLLAESERLAGFGSAEIHLPSGAVTFSAGMRRVLGEPDANEPVDEEWLQRRVPEEDQALLRTLRESVAPGQPREVRHRIRRSDGCMRHVVHRRAILCDGEGLPQRGVMILRDVTDEWQAASRIDRLTNFDEVTSLPNRNALRNWLHAATGRAPQDARRFALLAVDIGRFRSVYEAFGAAAMDVLRSAAAERLSKVVCAPDALAFVGDDTLAILLSRSVDVGEDEAMQMARSAVAALSGPIGIGDTEMYFGATVGIAAFPDDARDADELVRQAQAAAHAAQEPGGDQVCFYTPESNARVAARLGMESRLRRAIERDELLLAYQPQVDLGTGLMSGVEALLRWQDPVRGMLAPGEFITLAERTGLILPIGEWVLRKACEQGAQWAAAGLPTRVAVNLSGLQLQQPDIAHRIQAILLATGLDPRCLGIEVTESMLVDNVEHAARTLGELKSIGVEISIDDFGTGYSNLGHLRTLPVDVVKIDRSFVHDVTAPPEDVSITRAVITMAHSMQMRVLAEGVETEGQLALLIANGCDQMQGFYFSAPVDAEAVTAMLRENKRVPAHLLHRDARERTLLIVDDEENIVSALKRLLRKDGYTIVTANSGAQGLQRLAEHKVDVIVSDQRMPGMTGVEFLRRAKELYPETVRMVLSGYTELQSITDAINEGAIYKFLTKPWDDEQVRKHIAEAFQQKGLADENRLLGEKVLRTNRELAQVNERLQHLLSTQRQQISREEARISVGREVLENIPAPVIGFDVDGMIAFMNAGAEALFPQGSAMLGCDAAAALPPDVAEVWRHADGAYHSVRIAGADYRVVCRAMEVQAHGKLLVLVPVSVAVAEVLS